MALTDDLISHWKLNESTGTRVDSHGSNDLTDNNTVGSAVGVLDGAASFIASNDEYLSVADNSSISVGDIDFTFAGWVYLDDLDNARIWGQWSYGGNSRSHFLLYDSGSSRFRYHVSSNGSSGGSTQTVSADSLGAPSSGTWYFIVVWHDATANTINIQVNDGSVDSAAWSSGVFDTSVDFTVGAMLGSQDSASADGVFIDGRIDSLSFWKRVLTSQERSDLYNSGSGLDYEDFDGGGGVGLSIPVAMAHYRRMRAVSG